MNKAVFRDRMSHRRLMTLLSGLPPEGAFSGWLKDKSNRDLATYSVDKLHSGALEAHKINQQKQRIGNV